MVPYVNDGYTKGQMNVTLPVLSDLKSVLKEDFNDITKDASFYTTTSRFVAWLGEERQDLWLPKDDPSSWSSTQLPGRCLSTVTVIPTQNKVTLQILVLSLLLRTRFYTQRWRIIITFVYYKR